MSSFHELFKTMKRLAADFGNSSVSLGWGEDQLQRHEKYLLQQDYSWEDRTFPVQVSTCDEVLLASVNPPAEEAFTGWVQRRFQLPIRRYRRDILCPLSLDVDTSEQVGDDRLLTATAAWKRWGETAIIVDAGTAVTVDVVQGDGTFLGGMIAPGLTGLQQSLSSQAHQLPDIVPENGVSSVIGKNTREAMEGGVSYGFIGLVRELINRVKQALSSDAIVVGTGGNASFLADEIALDHVCSTLSLEGLFVSHAHGENISS